MTQPTEQTDPEPEESDNNPKPEDGVQDLSQDPATAYDEEGNLVEP